MFYLMQRYGAFAMPSVTNITLFDELDEQVLEVFQILNNWQSSEILIFAKKQEQ